MTKKNTIIEIIWRIALITAIFVYCCFSPNFSNKNAIYYYSQVHIIYILLITVLMSFKYLIFKFLIQKDKIKNIFISLILVILFMLFYIGIIKYLPAIYEPENWNFYKNYNSIKDFTNFIMLYRYYDTCNLEKLICFDAVLSNVIIIIEMLRNGVEGIVKYFFERIMRFLFKFYVPILFIIFLYNTSSKFYLVRNIKPIVSIFIGIWILLTIIKYYYMYIKMKKIRNEKIHNENLIIVIDEKNFKYSLSYNLFPAIKMFGRFEPFSLTKSLIIEGKNYIFISYDAERHNLIDLNKFKNISYFICLTGNSYQFLNDNTEFAKTIQKIINKDKFIIYCKSKSNLARNLKSEYKYRYIEKKNIKKNNGYGKF